MNARERHTVDISEEDLARNGLEVLARLRRDHPVCYVPSTQCWLVTRAADCEECQTNETVYKPFQPQWTVEPILGDYFIQGAKVTPDMWQRYRKGNEGVLGARPMNALTASVIAPAVEQQLQEIKGKREIDLLDDFFTPINIVVNKTVLGIPEVSNETMLRWFEGIGDCLNNMGADPERIERARTLRRELDAYFAPIIAEKYAKPDETWISHMLKYAWGDTLDEKRGFIQGNLNNMLFAGSKEGGEACVNTIIGMVSSPKDFAQFKNSPSEFAVLAGEEGLRWLPPAGSQRRTKVEVELGGATIPAEEDLIISLISANHDEAKFGEDAHLYRLNRFARTESGRLTHMSFGLLPRFCQGSTMVRALLKTALPRLFESYSDIKFAPDLLEKTAIGFVYNVNHLPCTLN
jgi:cytochrome P450